MNAVTRNKIFDAILAEALEECLDEELKKYDELKLYDMSELSPEYKKKMRKIINSVGRKDRIKRYKRIAIRSVMSIAAAFGLVFGILLTQPEVYAAVQNVFRSVFDKYDEYEYVGEELTIDNFDDSFRLGYVPDGYCLLEGHYSPVRVTLFYTNKTNDIIFEYKIANFSTNSYDNEHNEYSSFIFNDVEYHYYESNDSDFDNMLIWYKNGYTFGIYAQLSKDELVKIAENIEK